jgi:hypothetical protein
VQSVKTSGRLDINKANCASEKYRSCDGILLFSIKEINIQPLQGWFVVLRIFVSTGFTGGYFCSTPTGLIYILHSVKYGHIIPCTLQRINQ